MPFNPTTGLFTRVSNSFSNPILGTEIDPTDADSLFDDYDKALTQTYSSGTVGGTSSAITLTTGLGLTSLIDGQEFVIVPTATVVAALPTLAVDSVAAKNIKGSDGYSYSVYYNVQKNKPLRVRYSSALDVFVIQSPPLQWEETPFGHGRCKLQGSSATTLSLTQEDGQGLLIWNATTGSFRMVRFDTINATNIFAGSTTYVDGVANQNLANNQLYCIYVNNTDPTNQNANRLEFWRTYLGVGTIGWIPIGNEIGIYVKTTTAGGSTIDNTRTYVGMIWTGAGDISNQIVPATAMGMPVFSHFGGTRWKFGYQTTTVSNVTSSAVLATKTTPSIFAVTEGISDSPRFDAKATVTCDTSGAVVSFRIAISTLAFNGNTVVTNSPTYTAVATEANQPIHITASWESAPSQSVLTCKTDIAVSVGSATFVTDILGHIPQ